MKVFMGWSGEVSKKTAIALRDWLPYVIQCLKPYVSDRDIEAGSQWRDQLAKTLTECNFAIISLTPSNLNSQWIHFEAGVLSRTWGTDERVVPFLMGLTTKDIKDPLGTFQLITYTKQGVLDLIGELHKHVDPTNQVEHERLASTFETFWPRLQECLDPLKGEALAELKEQPATVKINADEVLAEILDLAREQRRLLASADRMIPASLSRFFEGVSLSDDEADLVKRLAENIFNLRDYASHIVTFPQDQKFRLELESIMSQLRHSSLIAEQLLQAVNKGKHLRALLT